MATYCVMFINRFLQQIF